MGKQGPCYHCGVTNTPLWRNGPPEKPILCNACGSRWRTKGTLVNYTPLHARSEEADEFEDHHRITKTKAIISNANKLKRKEKGVDQDTSNNRSNSGSAISNSDSCIMQQLDASELAGPTSQSSVVWDRDAIMVPPSRKRRCQLSVEKLTQDLYTILHEQQSYFSGSSEEQEDLIFESETPMVSVEIGHGSVLIRHPNNTFAPEEESEATSLSLHAKDVYNRDNKGKFLILTNHSSPFCYMDLRDIVNFDVFANHMTNDEQQQLLKYLPPIDSAQLPNSLKSMFDSPHFVENLCPFQKLLAEGSFDFSETAMKSEQYNLHQDAKYKKDSSRVCVVDSMASGCLVNVQSPPNTQTHSFHDDQDLLLDVPMPSHTAFPRAQLLSASSFL